MMIWENELIAPCLHVIMVLLKIPISLFSIVFVFGLNVYYCALDFIFLVRKRNLFFIFLAICEKVVLDILRRTEEGGGRW